MAGFASDELAHMVGQKIDKVIHLTFTDEDYQDFFLRLEMFRTSRAHVDFSIDELETRLRSFETLLQQLTEYFFYNVYKTYHVLTRQRKRIFYETMYDQARAYNFKLRKNILIQYSEFLSTLIAEPDLIHQIQIQVKIGVNPNTKRDPKKKTETFFKKFDRKVIKKIPKKIQNYGGVTLALLSQVVYSCYWNEESLVMITALGLLTTSVAITAYGAYKLYTSEEGVEENQFQIKDEIDYMINNPKMLDEKKQLFDKKLKEILEIENISEIQKPENLARIEAADRTKIERFYDFYKKVERIKTAINNIFQLLESKSKKKINDKNLNDTLGNLNLLSIKEYEKIYTAHIIYNKLNDLQEKGDKEEFLKLATKTLTPFLKILEKTSLPSQQPNV